MKKTIEQLHLASQYLAAAGISFVEKAADDSHTNLGWNQNHSRLETHLFDSGVQLAVNLESVQLEIIKQGEKIAQINLEGAAHSDVLKWISGEIHKIGIETKYHYQFHYELPYTEINEGDVFSFDKSDLNEISARLSIAQEAFQDFLNDNNLESPIRVWPHHFDLGIYVSIKNDGSLFMGAGLAIPDSLVDDLYYYASGYKNGSAIVTKDFSGLSNGDWRSDWNGATLASSQVDKSKAANFVNDVYKGFLANA